jgi:hypothetical protein
MGSSAGAAGLVLAALALAPAPPAAAAAPDPEPTGCVSNAAYGRLSVGQSLSFVRAVAGDSAQISMRRWTSGVDAYQERLYRMCTPTDAAHAVLTTRFMRFRGDWRAKVVDTMVGPERN